MRSLALRSRVLVVVGALFLAAACQKIITGGLSVDSSLRPFIPPDSTVLAGINLEELKASQFYQRHQNLLDIPLLTGMSSQIGFDPRRDLSQVVISWDGKDIVIMSRGHFPVNKMESQLAASSPAFNYKTHKLFGSDREALTFFENDIAIAGTAHAVEKAIDVNIKGDGEIPEHLATRLKQLAKEDSIWVVSRGTLPFADMPARSEYSSLLSNFTGYIGGTFAGIFVDSGLHLRGQVQCVSDEGAKRVNDALRGGIGLARLSTKDNELDLLRVYDAIHVRKEKENVFIEADIGPDMADQLLNKWLGSGRGDRALGAH